MSGSSGIEWTDWTWNPVTGCTKLTAGCDNCYAATLANRLLRAQYTTRLPVVDTTENREDPFSVRLWPDRLADPLLESRSRKVFVNSMSDLFHADVPDEYVQQVFQVMLEADWHIYQILTKRPGRALRFWKKHRVLFGGRPLPRHIWIGTSIEDQRVAYRIDHLRRLPAIVRFVSCEPLIGPVSIDLRGIHWLIAGGESGPIRRALELDWVRRLRDDCTAAGVPFFFKQVGGRTPKAGGRVLDGRTWDDYPDQNGSV